ncbi:hypothetical protein HHI36_007494 [Cryptolaemus montrouzieri]|uniref:P-type domain-containing protein n=1 Tax=Cryptolaemus montrouzieri TaxID=559131 RepID=A0ABD2MPS8_9CUCU
MTTFIETAIDDEVYNKVDYTDEENTYYSLLSKLRNEKIIFVVLLMALMLVLPFLLYLCIFDDGDFSKQMQRQCAVDSIYRITCGKENISNTECNNISCCFEPATNSCYHSEPSNYYYYRDSGSFVPSLENTPLGFPSLDTLSITVIEEPEMLRIFLNGSHPSKTYFADNTSKFDIVKSDKLSVTVFRKGTNEMLFTSLNGPLIASKEYLEWTFQLTNTSGIMFGLGELNIDLDENSTLTKIIYKNQDDHNTLPIFMAYSNGKYHAAKIMHEGALQVTILPSNLVLLRNLLGKILEIQILDGPTPRDIYKKIRNEETSSNLISEWGLGLHICREEPAQNLSDLLQQYSTFSSKRADYPDFTYESDCIHDDLLLHLLAEKSPNLTQIAEIVKSMGENFLLSYPPQIPINSKIFDKYKGTDIFFKNSTTSECYIGKYKGFDVAYPNYRNESVGDLVNDIGDLFEEIVINGISFTKSWPQDGSYQIKNSTIFFYNKQIEESLSNTLPWNLKDEDDFHLRYHNEYGSNVREIANRQFSKQNLSFSSVSNMMSFEPLIIQNVNSSWMDMKHFLRTSLYNSMFGHSLISVPVCGSNSDYDKKLQEDLCLRWYILAATMPLMRVSSTNSPRDPINLYSNYTINKVLDILQKRRQLVPYYRTILNNSEPLIRPMFFNFPEIENIHGLDEQYMIGNALLVAQPMSSDVQQLNIFLPATNVWYEFWGGMKYETKKGKEWIKYPIFKSDWVSFIAEGNIVAQVNTSNIGEMQITLVAALTKTGQAKGALLLYFSDEQSDITVYFMVTTGNQVTINTIEEKYDIIKGMIKTVCFYTYNETVGCDSANNYLR